MADGTADKTSGKTNSGGKRKILGLVGLAAAARVLKPAGREQPQPDTRSEEELANAHGRNAHAPTAMPRQGWMDILWRTGQEFGRDRLMMVAAGVAFYVLLSLAPAIAALVSLYGLFTDPASVGAQVEAMSGVLPGDAVAILREQVNRIASQPAGSLSLGFLFALGLSLWTANNGTKALFDALNVVYEERERRGFLRLTLTSLAFTLMMITLLILAMSGVVLVPVILSFIGLESYGAVLLAYLRWPLLFVLIALAIALVYRFGPDRRPPQWRWVSVGSLLAALLWLGGSMGFSWYVANFGSYNEVYGSLGAVVAFMTWIWLSAVIVLLGAELNAEIEHQTGRDTTVGPERPMGERGAFVADTLGKLRKH